MSDQNENATKQTTQTSPLDTIQRILLAAGLTPENLPAPTKSYRQIVKEEAERIRQEEELENGLWGQLPPGERPE